MALKWRLLTITDKDGANNARAASKWARARWPKIILGEPGSGTAQLKGKDGATLVNDQALARLAELVATVPGARLQYDGKAVMLPQPPKPRPAPARRDAVTVVRNPPPTYVLEVVVGDPDALFDPIAGGKDPWLEVGVRQRLQMLGYLYTPLQHPSIERDAKLCWIYYRDKVHRLVGNDGAALVVLAKEVRGNLVASEFPTRGKVLDKSKLPDEGAFGALRFPGGYCSTQSAAGNNLNQGDGTLNAGKDSKPPKKYQFILGARRDEIEDVVFAENDRMGLFPILARVVARRKDKADEPADGAPVIFELVDPDDHTGTDFVAPTPRAKVLNYSVAGVYWAGTFPYQKKDLYGFKDTEKDIWAEIHRLTVAADAADSSTAATTAKAWIDDWAVPAWNDVKAWWGDETQKPYCFMTGAAPSVKTAAKALLDGKSKPGACKEPDWKCLGRMKAAVETLSPGDRTGDVAQLEAWVGDWGALGKVSAAQVAPWRGGVVGPPVPLPAEKIAARRRPSTSS